jgi:PII-like signaling protein
VGFVFETSRIEGAEGALAHLRIEGFYNREQEKTDHLFKIRPLGFKIPTGLLVCIPYYLDDYLLN